MFHPSRLDCHKSKQDRLYAALTILRTAMPYERHMPVSFSFWLLEGYRKSLSNCEQPAFHGQVDNASISLPQGRGSTLRLAANGRGVNATILRSKGRRHHASLQLRE